MKKLMLLLMIAIAISSCSVNRKNYPASLKGQKWTWDRNILRHGTASGNEWIFISDKDLIEKSWYSGGMCWAHTYSGIYYYDEKTKVVYLKYNKNKQSQIKFTNSSRIKNTMKKAIKLIDVNNQLMPRFYDNWKLENNQLKALEHKEIPTDSLVIFDLKEKFNFKIENEGTEK